MADRPSVVLAAAFLAFAAGTVAAAGVDTPDGVVVQPGYGSIPESSLLNPDDPTFVPDDLNPPEGVLPPARDESPFTMPGEGCDWGWDHEIYGGSVGSCYDFDVDPSTGYLYTAFDTEFYDPGDSIRVFRSTDSGVTWTDWGACVNTDGDLQNAKIRVMTAGGYTWVCVLCLYEETTGADNLWLRRWSTDGSNSTWEMVDDDVIFADMDGDIGSSGYLYVTYVPDDTEYNVFVARNALAGAGWVNNISLFDDTEVIPNPAIAAGEDGVVTVAFLDTRLSTNEEIRIKRSSDYAASWLSSEQVSNNTGGADLVDPDIAHARGTSAWICAEYSLSGRDLWYYYSTNTGSTWTLGGVFPDVGSEYNASLRSSKGDGSVALAYTVSTNHCIKFAWADASAPAIFSTPVQISNLFSLDRGVAGWLSTGTYPAIEYIYSITRWLLFDSWDNTTSIADGDVSSVSCIGVCPNPFRDAANIGFSLDNSGPVGIEIFDVSGRLVTTLAECMTFASGSHTVTWNGTAEGVPVPGGIYIVRMTSQGSTQSARMVLAR